MADEGYYEILGVSKSADAADIKKAYRKLALKYHPDHNKDDKDAEQKFKEITQAYEILKDPDKRAAYDRYGKAAFEGGGGRGGGAGFSEFGGFGSAFADIFEDMFGGMGGAGGRSQTGPRRGSDIQYTMELSLEDAYNGKDAELTFPVHETCEECDGSGAEKDSGVETCPTCEGGGRVRAQQGFFTIERTCPTCQGAGQIIRNPCKACNGNGVVSKEKSLKIKIPPGVDSGRRIRLSGEGEAGFRGGPSGDLYILTTIKPHQFFHRQDANLHARIPVPMTTAALGGEIEVPTISGKTARVVVPDGTQTGQKIRMREHGMPILRSDQYGDMFIEVQVETPVNLNKKQKELLKELDESMNGGSKNKDASKSNSPKTASFMNKMKELWEDMTE